jgi:CheY-like chemotaxis protein
MRQSADRLTSPTILIVDDDLDSHRLIHAVLRPLGAVFVAAWDGIAAVSVARKEASDLIILDFRLPAGDGKSALRRLQMLPALMRTPILVVSASDPEPTGREMLEAGAAAYLQKPIEPQTLLATASRLLAES